MEDKFTQKNENMLLALRAHCSELGMPKCDLRIQNSSWDLCWQYNNALILSTLLWQFCWLKRDKVQWCATVVPWGAPSEEDYYTSIEYEKGETPGWQANMVDLPAVDAPALGVRFSQRFSVAMNWKVAHSADKPLSRRLRHRGGTQALQCPEDEIVMCENCSCMEVEQDGEDRCNMCLRAAGMDVSGHWPDQLAGAARSACAEVRLHAHHRGRAHSLGSHHHRCPSILESHGHRCPSIRFARPRLGCRRLPPAQWKVH